MCSRTHKERKNEYRFSTFYTGTPVYQTLKWKKDIPILGNFFSDKNYLVNINQIHNLVITKAMIFNKGVI